jgi:hypothetical protein
MPAGGQLGQPDVSVLCFSLRHAPRDEQTRRRLFTYSAEPWGSLRHLGIGDRSHQRTGGQRPDAGDLLELLAELASSVPRDDLPLELQRLSILSADNLMFHQSRRTPAAIDARRD